MPAGEFLRAYFFCKILWYAKSMIKRIQIVLAALFLALMFCVVAKTPVRAADDLVIRSFHSDITFGTNDSLDITEKLSVCKCLYPHLVRGLFRQCICHGFIYQ